MPTCGKSNFLDFAGPVTTLTAGSLVQVEIKVTAHHKGHFQFRLCDRAIDSSLGGLSGEEACLNEHILERARPEEIHSDCQPNDKRGDCQPFDEANPSYWYLPPASVGDSINLLETSEPSLAQVKSHTTASANYKFHYHLPGVTCEVCTLQWWWLSANSCTPHPDAYRCYFQEMQSLGWNASDWCGGACSFAGTCPDEQGPMQNCGEQFKNCADVRLVHGSSPTPPVGPAPTPPEEPEPESEEEEEEAEEEEDEQQPTTSQAVSPTPSPSMVCTANPAKIVSDGVSDESCSKCAEGYQWWPCNGGDLCECTTGLIGLARKRHQSKDRFLGLIQQRDEVRKGAFEFEGTGGSDEL